MLLMTKKIENELLTHPYYENIQPSDRKVIVMYFNPLNYDHQWYIVNGEKLPNFYEDISKSVENAKIVVFNGYYDDKLKNKIEPILKSDFTTKIPDSLKSIDSPHSHYTIYYSKKL